MHTLRSVPQESERRSGIKTEKLSPVPYPIHGTLQCALQLKLNAIIDLFHFIFMLN